MSTIQGPPGPGDIVVHATYGIGTVERVEEQSVLGQNLRFLKVRFRDDRGVELELMANAAKLESSLMRRPVSREELPQILEHFGRRDVEPVRDTKLRNKLNDEAVKSGDIYRLCDVVNRLRNLAETKPLTLRERGVMGRAQHILLEELSLVEQCSAEEMAQRMELEYRHLN